jgi:hypothetical protein
MSASDIRVHNIEQPPHIAALMRATGTEDAGERMTRRLFSYAPLNHSRISYTTSTAMVGTLALCPPHETISL